MKKRKVAKKKAVRRQKSAPNKGEGILLKTATTWTKIDDFVYHIKDKKWEVIIVCVCKRETSVEELNQALENLYLIHSLSGKQPPAKGQVLYFAPPPL